MVFNFAFLAALLKAVYSVQLSWRKSLASLAGSSLLVLGMLLPTLAQAQTFLDFTGPATLSSGTALSQGAVYRYANVLPGIDALVTLALFSGTTPALLNLDDNATFPARFQPVITCAGTAAANANTTCYSKFDFAFVVAGTSTPTPVYGLVASAQDVDGNSEANGVREFVEFTGSSSVRVGTSTITGTSTLVVGTAIAGGVRYNQTNPLDVQVGIGTGNQYEVYANYVSAITGLSIIGGNIVGSAGCLNTAAQCQRQNSYTFLPLDSNLPSMTVRKISTGGTGTFSFSGTNGWVTQPVNTVAAGVARDSQSETLLDVNVATTITEAPPFGYSLQSIACTGLGAGTATPTVNGVNGGSVLISAAASVSGNNIVCTFTNRKLVANLSIIKNDGVTTVVAGNTVTYTITAVNNGPDSAAGAVIKDTPSAGLNCGTVTCASTAAGMCPAASFPFASLTTGINIAPSFPTGSTATLTVSCGVTATGQ